MDIKQVTFKNGVKGYAFTSFDEIIDFVSEKKGLLVALNAGKIGRSSEEMKAIINRNIGYADGMAATMALKKHGVEKPVKIAGCDLWLKIIDRKYKDSTFYLVGGKQEVIDQTVVKLKEDYPGISIIGYRNGYLKEKSDEEALLKDIQEKKPDVVFVAMGSPKQELLMERMLQFNPAIYQGLGGSFDVYTGRMKRAPEWLIKHNLEGPYRVMTDKKKWKRFIMDLIVVFKIKLGLI